MSGETESRTIHQPRIIAATFPPPRTREEQPDEDWPLTDEVVRREVWRDNVYRVDGHMFTGGLVIDVGANVGAFTVLAALAHPRERVLAVEPTPSNAVELRKAVELNGLKSRVVVSTCAVGGREGAVTMSGDGGGAEVGDWQSGPVPLTTLPALLERHAAEDGLESDEVDVVKLDCEGCEWELFQDEETWHVLGRARWVVAEWHKCEPPDIGHALGRLLDTHSVECLGHPERGGMLWAHRYDV